MKITVSDYHIRHGSVMSGRFCPIAMAITFRARGVAEVFDDGSVGLYDVDRGPRKRFILRDTPYKQLQLPAEVIAWMQSYDKTGKAQPITFELPIEEAA